MHHELRILILGLTCLAGVAGAQTKPDTAIRYRQGVMNVMGWNFDQLGAVVRHTGALDAKEFALRAERLAALGAHDREVGRDCGHDLRAFID